jgi:hypothetical protein
MILSVLFISSCSKAEIRVINQSVQKVGYVYFDTVSIENVSSGSTSEYTEINAHKTYEVLIFMEAYTPSNGPAVSEYEMTHQVYIPDDSPLQKKNWDFIIGFSGKEFKLEESTDEF